MPLLDDLGLRLTTPESTTGIIDPNLTETSATIFPSPESIEEIGTGVGIIDVGPSITDDRLITAEANPDPDGLLGEITGSSQESLVDDGLLASESSIENLQDPLINPSGTDLVDDPTNAIDISDTIEPVTEPTNPIDISDTIEPVTEPTNAIDISDTIEPITEPVIEETTTVTITTELPNITLSPPVPSVDTQQPPVTENIPAFTPGNAFNSGTFKVLDPNGKVSIDYLTDGGLFQSQIAIVSLAGLASFALGSDEWMTEVISRAQSNSTKGQIVIDDRTEGGKFKNLGVGETNHNTGQYQGVKSFQMEPGDDFIIVIAPNNSFANIAPKDLIFSASAANADGIFPLNQIADVSGEGSTFAMEDLRPGNAWYDKDYNDIIFQVRGAFGTAPHISNLINPDKDWRGTNAGKALIEYANPYITPMQPPIKTDELAGAINDLFTELETNPEIAPETVSENDTNSEIIPETTSPTVDDLTVSENDTNSEIISETTSPTVDDLTVSETDTNSEIISETTSPTVDDLTVSETDTNSEIISETTSETVDDLIVSENDTNSEIIPETTSETVDDLIVSENDTNSEIIPEATSETVDDLIVSENDTNSEIISETTSETVDDLIVSETDTNSEVIPETTSETVDDLIVSETDTNSEIIPETTSAIADNLTVSETEQTAKNDRLSWIQRLETATETLQKLPANVSSDVISSANLQKLVTLTEQLKQPGNSQPIAPTTTAIIQKIEGMIEPISPIYFPKIEPPKPPRLQITELVPALPSIDNTPLPAGTLLTNVQENTANFSEINGVNSPEEPIDSSSSSNISDTEVDPEEDDTIFEDTPVVNRDFVLNPALTQVTLDGIEFQPRSSLNVTNLADFIPSIGAAESQGIKTITLNLNPTESLDFLGESKYGLDYAKRQGITVFVPSDSPIASLVNKFDNLSVIAAAKPIHTEQVATSKLFDVPTGAPSNNYLTVAASGVNGDRFSPEIAVQKVAEAFDILTQINPGLSDRQKLEIINLTSTDLRKDNWDANTGAGLINLESAIWFAKATDPEPVTPEKTLSNDIPEIVKVAIERAQNLDNYDPEALANTHQWVVGITGDTNIPGLLAGFNASNLGNTRYIPDSYIIEFPSDLTASEIQKRLKAIDAVSFAYPLVAEDSELRAPNDPLFSQQWHLKNTGQTGNNPRIDLNVEPVWNQKITGNNVVIGIIDNGVQYDHPDLISNYRPDLSRDFNERLAGGVYDHNPYPNLSGAQANHGTAVAGVALGQGNNATGITGIAYNADFAALRLLGASTTDLQRADAFSYLNDDIDIYNNSWGPKDDGQTLAGPGPLAQMALYAGATQGRDGLGNVYVWAAGNGAQNQDNVNYDGYANSRYAIAVAAVDDTGEKAAYSERGSSLLVSAPSSRTINNNGVKVTTTDLVGIDGQSPTDYTNTFGGTSAAAAAVSGVVALMLEANPTLTWRDIQQILVDSAVKNDPTDPGWRVNGAGRNINYKYGFGAVDANAAVNLAKSWQSLNPEVVVSSGKFDINDPDPLRRQGLGILPDVGSRTVKVNIAEDITLEKVEVRVDVDHSNRGNLRFVLISPDGTRSALAQPHNDTGDNYDNWVFTSTRNWGESSQGEWKLQVTDVETGTTGIWNSWQLNLYGSKPSVSLVVTDGYIKEGTNDHGEMTITRTGNTKYALPINLHIQGNTTDISALPQIVIPAGSSSIKVPIVPIDDTETEWTERMDFYINPSPNYEGKINNKSGYVLIYDNEKTVAYIEYAEWYPGQPHQWHESNYLSESNNGGWLRFQRYGDITQPLTVNYSITGSATPDDLEMVNSVTFPAYIYYADKELKAKDDNLVEGDEEGIFTLNPSSNYDLGNSKSTKVIISDNDDKPAVSIAPAKIAYEIATAAAGYAYEGGDTNQFIFTRTGSTTEPLTVDYVIYAGGAHATYGEDYQTVDSGISKDIHGWPHGSITIPAGSSTATIDIVPTDDAIPEDIEYVSFLLKSSGNYAIAKNDYAAIVIPANDNIEVKWKQQLGTTGFDYSNGVSTDDLGNIYMAGRTSSNFAGQNAGAYDAWIAKYRSDGTEVWKKQLGTSGYEEARSIATDSAGNSYITGWTDGSMNGTVDNTGNSQRDAWIAKYDAAGNLKWRNPIGSVANAALTGYDIANGSMSVGKDGEVFITGLTYGNLAGTNQGQTDAWFAKVDQNTGLVTWVKQLGTSSWDEAKAIDTDSAGNIYVTGETKGNLAGTAKGDVDAWVAKFDSSGNLDWKQQLGTTAEDTAQSIAVTDDGLIYVTGLTRGAMTNVFAWATGKGDAWLLQLNNNGDTIWGKQIASSEFDTATGVSVDKAGNAYITGRTRSSLPYSDVGHQGGEDTWVMKWSRAGAWQWTRQVGTAGDDIASGIVVGTDGVYVTGSTNAKLGDTYYGGTDGWLVKIG